MGSAERLAALRSLLQDHGISAYIVPSEDAHQSEYTAEQDKRRAFLTGFTGSAGIAVVTRTHALLWTDGRYHLQARQQLQGEWKLMKLGEDASPEDWVAKESSLPSGANVGVDPTTVSLSTLKRWEKRLEEAHLAVKRLDQNLVDKIWKDRPSPPKTSTRIQPESLSGHSVSKKLRELREALEKEKAGALVVTALDEVAWLYNMRGEDVLYSPVVHAYAFVTKSRAILYIDTAKVTDEVARHLDENGVTVKPYHGRAILDDITLFGSSADAATGKLWLDPASANAAIGKVLPEGQLIEKASPLALAKAVKNPVELDGLRAAHIRDAVAMVQFMEWLDNEVQQQFGVSGYFSSTGHTNKRKRNEEHGRVRLTEVTLADKLESFRARQQHFVGLSFPTISSVGSNAAVIHYGPQRDTCADFDPAKIYLCDSGAQYLDGTTDVTRTFHFGTPSDHEKECFTRVLKGHIGLDTVIFPSGTTGHMLDALARLPLWRVGLDYRHGTGHGVGSFLFVHEGPHLISFKPTASNAGIKANMTVTNEPGYYEDGAFGCRIENVLVVKEVKLANNIANKGYLGFEPITLVPLQAKLIDTSLLTGEELAWVDAYHATCREKLSPLLTGATLEWLVKATSPITQAG